MNPTNRQPLGGTGGRIIEAAARFGQPRPSRGREFRNGAVRSAYFGYVPGIDVGGDAA